MEVIGQLLAGCPARWSLSGSRARTLTQRGARCFSVIGHRAPDRDLPPNLGIEGVAELGVGLYAERVEELVKKAASGGRQRDVDDLGSSRP